MTPRVLALALTTLTSLATLTAPDAMAQGLRAPGAPGAAVASPLAGTPAPAAAPSAVAATRQADFIVAIVNSEPITNSEFRIEAQRLIAQLNQQRRPLPSNAELSRVVIERMITDRAILQTARENGIRIEDAAVDQAEQNVARQNRVEVAELRRRVATEGFTATQFREQLRDQIMLIRLREREVDGRVRVSDLEVEQFRREQLTSPDAPGQEVNLAQVLVAVPDTATPAQVEAFKARAESVLTRARAGEDFAALAREFSDSPDRANGGQLGLRTPDRYPPLFMDATKDLAEGALSGVIKSGAGFHVLKVVEKRLAGMSVLQSRARHILLRNTPQLTQAAARARLLDYKSRIQSGAADFAALAREHSQDGSAAQGGDLGWVNPGQFVPEFEEVMNALAPGQVSDPLISRFGVHLIQLMERRNGALSPKEQTEVLRNMLREKKLDEAYATWAQDIRGKAYVELREAPQ